LQTLTVNNMNSKRNNTTSFLLLYSSLYFVLQSLEESRGGFVLQANTTLANDNSSGKSQRLVLDKHGKPSLRKTIVNELKMIRQRSTGDIQV